MIRILIVRLLLFILPFVLYAAYMHFVKGEDITDRRTWRTAPLTALLAVSATIVAISFVALAFNTGSDPDGDYLPARMEDGELVPGRIDDDRPQ